MAKFTKIEMNSKRNINFHLNMRLCLKKVSRLKLYLPRQKWTMNETLILYKKVFFTFSILFLISFLLARAHVELLFGVKLGHCISFDVFHILRNKKKTINETYSFLEVRHFSVIFFLLTLLKLFSWQDFLNKIITKICNWQENMFVSCLFVCYLL